MQTLKRMTCRFWTPFSLGIAVVGLLTVVNLLPHGVASAASSVLIEYNIPGKPLHLAVQEPGRIWFTLPESNAIGSLVVTSTVDFKFTQYDAPTAGASPYDLAYDGQDALWFSEQSGNRIARLDISTGAITEYTIPTANSSPTGIAIAPDGSVWFTERDGDKLGRFDPQAETFSEFPYPTPNGKTEDIVIHRNGEVRISAPALNLVFGYRPSTGEMYDTPTVDIALGQDVEEPWNLALDSSDVLWVTTRKGNRLGRFMPGTVTFWRWFVLPQAGSAPTGITLDVADGLSRVWFTLPGTGRVGRIEMKSTGEVVSQREYGLPSDQSGPIGVAVDTQGHVWIAENGAQKIAEWRPPYFEYQYFIYLPLHFFTPGFVFLINASVIMGAAILGHKRRPRRRTRQV